MKFNFKISKRANFYFFVQNLSEWHFSNRKDYNVLWKKELGQFSSREKHAIKQFKEIHLRYPFGKMYLGHQFFLEKDPWKTLDKKILQKDYIELKNAFSLLEDKFNLLYKRDLSFLKKWRKALIKKSNNKRFIEKILDSLSILYKASIIEKEIDIYLLFSSLKHTGGGANIGSKSITLEISRYPLKDINHVLGIIWHEIIHLFFQERYFYPLLLKYFKKNRKKANFINELVAGALFPRGILGIRLLKNRPIAQLLSRVTKKQTILIVDLAKEYLDKNKFFDKEFIKRLEVVIKN
ncbi:MAG: hypothetical protein ABIC36_03950 [bacterium]